MTSTLPRRDALATELGGEAVSAAKLADEADVVVLCHKPQQLEEVAAEIHPSAVVSILAATTTEQVERAYPDTPVYRFIPNIPAEVRKGVLCYVPGRSRLGGPRTRSSSSSAAPARSSRSATSP